MKKTVTVVISAWNEEKKIERCLKSVSWADEIIVIDSSSTDKTPILAKKYTRHVLKRPNNPMLNVNKNYGFSKATSDFILSLDADEIVDDTLSKEIQMVLSGENVSDGYWMPRKNILFGKWIKHGLWWPDKQLRLFRRNKGKFACKHVHEYVSVEGSVADLESPLVHYNYESISQYIRKVDAIYTINEVEHKKSYGYQVVWYDALRMPFSDFLKVFFAQKGYKDGVHGLILAILQAFYAFIVFAKLWEEAGFPEQEISGSDLNKEIVRSGKQLTYWQTTRNVEESSSLVETFYYRLKRKLRIEI